MADDSDSGAILRLQYCTYLFLLCYGVVDTGAHVLSLTQAQIIFALGLFSASWNLGFASHSSFHDDDDMTPRCEMMRL